MSPFYVILALYSIILLMYALVSIFIVYHLLKYSTDQTLKAVSIIFFTVISLGLLFSNLMLFFSINWNKLISSVFLY